MARNERLEKLVIILQQRNGASVKELAAELGVTEMTVRRDMKTLSERGVVSLVHGVAIYRPNQTERDKLLYNLQREQDAMSREKEAIGRTAASLIEPGEVVVLDTGTTAAWVARNIPQNLQITVVCFALNTLVEVQRKNVQQIIMSGGFYYRETQAFVCEEMITMLKGRRATKAFIVPSGASVELGLTCYSAHEVAIKRLGLSNSLQKILLLDSSKFGKVRANCFGEWDQIDTVITDKGITEEWMEFLQSRNIQVIVAEP